MFNKVGDWNVDGFWSAALILDVDDSKANERILIADKDLNEIYEREIDLKKLTSRIFCNELR